MDASGKGQEIFQSGGVRELRTANLALGAQSAIVAFGTGTDVVTAFDSRGQHLWDYATEHGINDVTLADLNGDGLDEVIVGYNGNGGVHVLGPEGKLTWDERSISNVWHVAVGHLKGPAERVNVLATASDGYVHVFTPEGRKLTKLKTKCYATFIETVHEPGAQETFVVGGKSEDALVLTTLDPRGWQARLASKSASIGSSSEWGAQGWLALGIWGGDVAVVDVSSGNVVAEATGQGRWPQVTWLTSTNGQPLLIVATGDELRAFQVTK